MRGEIVVAGPWAYVAEMSQPAILVFDISNVWTPQLRSDCSIPTAAWPFNLDIDTDRSLLAVTERTSPDPFETTTLALFDISVPTAPRLWSRLGSATSSYRTVSLSSDAAYVTDVTSVRKVDVSDLENPIVTTAVCLGYTGATMRAQPDGYVYVGLGGAVLAVLKD